MKHLKERRTGRLFPFPVYGRFWLLTGVLILAYFFVDDFQASFRKQYQVSAAAASLAKASDGEQADKFALQVQKPQASQLNPDLQSEIESLFAEIRKAPENKEDLLLSLKRLLQQSFEGQEDCWSCEGTDYFNRFDQIAGSGEARKPLGFREWIELGDEAFQKKQVVDARRFYTQALQVIDERALDLEDTVDIEAVTRVRDRCAELECR